MFYKTKEQKDRDYKKIHAMYSKGYTFDEIYGQCSDMEKWEVMDIYQTIYGKEQQRKERQELASSKEDDGHEVYDQRRLRKKNRSYV